MDKAFLLLFSVFILACSTDTKPEEDHTLAESGAEAIPIQSYQDGTTQMVSELRSIAADRSQPDVWHLNRVKAQRYDSLAQRTKDPGQFITYMYQSASEWLNTGEYGLAIARLEQVIDILDQSNFNLAEADRQRIEQFLAVCHLRKAEIENCINNHNEYSCILPIQKEGQHALKDGSERASQLFQSILDDNPGDVQTRWLYMIAQMTLGRYPEKVPAKYRFPTDLLQGADFQRFPERAMSYGLAVDDISGGVILDDFNNDHHLDLLVSSYGLDDQLRFFLNDGQGNFTDQTAKAGLTGILSGLNLLQADINNDGFLDVLVLRGAWLGKSGKHPNSLLLNDGKGGFIDVTRSAGLYSLYPTQTADWADYDGDGWIDLFIGNEYSQAVDAPCQLFHNKGDGTFEEVAAAHKLNVRDYIKGCSWADIDNDGYPDLYLSSVTGPNKLFRNTGPNGGYKFEDVTTKAGVREPQFSFPCWHFDYDQDGDLDLFVSGFDFSQFESAAGQVALDYLGQPVQAELPRLYDNDGTGRFSEVSSERDLDKVLYTMGCNYGDLNNDGYPDFYAGTGTPDFRALVPNRMFLNDGGQRFLDVTTAGGFGHLQKGHGIAFGDLNHDGQQDIYQVLGGSYDGDHFMNALMVNPGFENNWVRLKLVGATANKAAIGARLTFTVISSDGKKRKFYNHVSSGASFGANTLWVEQGLGKYAEIEELSIQWPGTQEVQIINNLQPQKSYIIHQDRSEAALVKLESFSWKDAGHHHHHSGH